MAVENTFEMDTGGYSYDQRGCVLCGTEANHRGFYYPTCMNGDAQHLGDYCETHKDTDLSAVSRGRIALRYPVEGVKKVTLIIPEN